MSENIFPIQNNGTRFVFKWGGANTHKNDKEIERRWWNVKGRALIKNTTKEIFLSITPLYDLDIGQTNLQQSVWGKDQSITCVKAMKNNETWEESSFVCNQRKIQTLRRRTRAKSKQKTKRYYNWTRWLQNNEKYHIGIEMEMKKLSLQKRNFFNNMNQ